MAKLLTLYNNYLLESIDSPVCLRLLSGPVIMLSICLSVCNFLSTFVYVWKIEATKPVKISCVLVMSLYIL